MDLPTYAQQAGVSSAEFKRTLEGHGINVSVEIVRRWLLGKQAPGAKTVAAIEAATLGKVTRHDMRPDIFGPPPTQQQPPAEAA